MNWKDLPGITEKRKSALVKAGCNDPRQLLDWAPLRYELPAVHVPMVQLDEFSGKVSTVGTVVSFRTEGFGGSRRLIVQFSDLGARLEAVWFKGSNWIERMIENGARYQIKGTIGSFRGKLQMTHPEIKRIHGDYEASISSNDAGYLPIYPSTADMKSTRITHAQVQKWIEYIIGESRFIDHIPAYIRSEMKLPGLHEAYTQIHIPTRYDDWEPGLKRMRFDELFLFELAVMKLKGRNKVIHEGIQILEVGELTRSFINSLPFELTEGQRLALREIFKDLKSGRQMSRLIQGDVGAGKTVVAIASMLMMADFGYQSALMAPTEILAEQHYRTIKQYLSALGLDVVLLTGSKTGKHRKEVLAAISSGFSTIAIGTHALIEDDVLFSNLGLVVVDEQHRFGVMQRAKLQLKDSSPHMLVMSATPIPRSLALTLYGELDISVVKGLPAGRKQVRTVVRNDNQREDVYAFADELLDEGGQIYIVYPLVEESEAMDLKDATAGFEHLKDRFTGRKLGLIHGRLKSAEKDATMKLFKDGELDILVSTTVIEVGVDVPNANMMIIEHAERFGLSQLHQLRGRIGRGERQSYCVLMADFKRSADARERLATMERTNDGFEIAEADLKLRGPGDFLGTRQSGLPAFKFADIVRDQDLLEYARDYAHKIITSDPQLVAPEHTQLRQTFTTYLEEKSSFFELG
jgi:ATP-dependent DNA helicase RecG